jgi:hypothetical protein
LFLGEDMLDYSSLTQSIKNMKVPSFEEAINAKDIYDYELHRNVAGWQLSYCGEEISLLITDEQAKQILEKMNDGDLDDQAYEVD